MPSLSQSDILAEVRAILANRTKITVTEIASEICRRHPEERDAIKKGQLKHRIAEALGRLKRRNQCVKKGLFWSLGSV